MNLANWLQKLAAACSAEPKDVTVEVYLEELGRWKLTDEQWAELRRRAILRHRFPRMMPLIAELYDIAVELRQEAERNVHNHHLRDIASEPREPPPAGLDLSWMKKSRE